MSQTVARTARHDRMDVAEPASPSSHHGFVNLALRAAIGSSRRITPGRPLGVAWPSTGMRLSVYLEIAMAAGGSGSDETLVDVAPSPARSWLDTGGDWVVARLVVRFGVLV